MQPRKNIPRARQLRSASTDAESLLWLHLRGRRLNGAKFRRQFSIAGFIADFVCIEVALIVEIDGGQHAQQIARDTRRSEILRDRGYRVLRFWNNEVLRDLDGVLTEIASALIEPPSPQPSPASGRGGKSAQPSGPPANGRGCKSAQPSGPPANGRGCKSSFPSASPAGGRGRAAGAGEGGS